MTGTIRDKAAIVGIGQTPFAKHLGRSELDMAIEAILAACEDAGISPRAIDGIVRYDMETTDEENLYTALGQPDKHRPRSINRPAPVCIHSQSYVRRGGLPDGLEHRAVCFNAVRAAQLDL